MRQQAGLAAGISAYWLSSDPPTVQCTWDAEAAVWVAASDDVPGLATGAETLDALVDKLKVVIPELLEANGLLPADHQGGIPFAIMAQRHERAPVEA